MVERRGAVATRSFAVREPHQPKVLLRNFDLKLQASAACFGMSALQTDDVQINPEDVPCQRHQVVVMRQEHDLHAATQFTQDSQARRCSQIVEVDEEIICDQRHVESLIDLKLEGRQP